MKHICDQIGVATISKSNLLYPNVAISFSQVSIHTYPQNGRI